MGILCYANDAQLYKTNLCGDMRRYTQTPEKEDRMIETRLLNYFLAVAREQSITKAADSLHIAQPTLSKQMMELEDQLGKPLLIRGKKKITLTEEGAFLRSQAQEIMNLLDKTESAFSAEEEVIAGDVYLGCGETPIMSFITDIFKEIQQDYPQIRFHIYSGDAESVLARLNQGTLDLCLLIGALHQDAYTISIWKCMIPSVSSCRRTANLRKKRQLASRISKICLSFFRIRHIPVMKTSAGSEQNISL